MNARNSCVFTKLLFWGRNINFGWRIVEAKLSVMKLRVCVYLNHHCTTIFHGDTAVTRHQVIAVFMFLTSESPILEQKYQFHLTHCRNKVVRYEITSPCIFESSLYDDFRRRYVRFRSFSFIFITTSNAIISETVSPNVSKLHGHLNLISNNNMLRFQVCAIKNGRFHFFQTDPPLTPSWISSERLVARDSRSGV